MTATGVDSAEPRQLAPGYGIAVAYLPAALRRRIQVAESRIALADSWQAAVKALRESGGGVIIADPTDGAGTIGKAMSALCTEMVSVIPVAYSRLTPVLVGHLRSLSQFEFSEVILFDYDDTPDRFAELADLAEANSLSATMLTFMEPQVSLAPARVRGALRDLFHNPQRYRSVGDLAAAASMPRRSFYRQVTAAGFPSPRLLLSAGRVVRALGLLGAPRRTLRETAMRLGYAKAEQLAAHVTQLTGLRVREARMTDPRVLARLIVDHLVNGPETQLPRSAGEDAERCGRPIHSGLPNR